MRQFIKKSALCVTHTKESADVRDLYYLVCFSLGPTNIRLSQKCRINFLKNEMGMMAHVCNLSTLEAEGRAVQQDPITGREREKDREEKKGRREEEKERGEQEGWSIAQFLVRPT